MPRQPIVNETLSVLEQAKESAKDLLETEKPYLDTVFEGKTLADVENGIKNLNNYAEKCYIASALALYSIIYDKQLYTESGLPWEEYTKQTKERLGIDRCELSRQLTSARFFVKHHKQMLKAGWKPEGSRRKLEKAEYVLSLSGSVQQTIKHLVKDTWREFFDWYSSLIEKPKALSLPEDPKVKVSMYQGKFYLNDIEAVKVSEELPVTERMKLNQYIEQIFESISAGYEPAIIPVYDKKEAAAILRLRDKRREEK